MKHDARALAITAVSGLVAGCSQASSAPKPDGSAAVAANVASSATPDGSSKKACCAGKNECKGKGGCKTASNDCAGKNECKGKGGCSMRKCD